MATDNLESSAVLSGRNVLQTDDQPQCGWQISGCPCGTKSAGRCRSFGSTRGRGGNSVREVKTKWATILCLLCFVFVACSPTHPKQTRSEIIGTQQERVAQATSILVKYCQLPGPFLDAHMAEDVIGDDWVPGPSDSWLSGVLIIPASDLAKWREVLSPAISPTPSPKFTSPIAPPSWWPAVAAFKDCEFYSPKKFADRSGGFVALSPSASAIYFSTTKY